MIKTIRVWVEEFKDKRIWKFDIQVEKFLKTGK